MSQMAPTDLFGCKSPTIYLLATTTYIYGARIYLHGVTTDFDNSTVKKARV